MKEFAAAIAGAVIGVGGTFFISKGDRQSQARDAVIRLTEAVEHIARQLEILHQDMKEDRRETYERIGSVEQRLSRLEAMR